MKFCCASNAAKKMSKSQGKKNQLFPKIFSTKSPFKKQNTDF